MRNTETINDRINRVVQHSGLTKTAFAQKINVSQQYVSKIVNSGNPSDRTISDICREFGVDEVWLRTGVGEMFRQRTREEEIMTFAMDTIAGSEEFRKSLVTMLAKLDADDWEHLAAIFGKMTGEKEE